MVGYRVVIISPNADDERFRNDYEDENVSIEQFKIEEISKRISKSSLYQLFLRTRRFTLPGKHNLSTLEFKENVLRTNIKNKSSLFKCRKLLPIWLSNILRYSRLFRTIFFKLESLLFFKEFHRDLFIKHEPDILVLTDLGTVQYSNFIMHEAKVHGVPIVSVILSWDNLTAKGCGAVKPDYAVAWNENMKWELENYHEIPASRIFVGGVPHFDGYFRSGYFLDKRELQEMLGFSDGKKVVFYGTASPFFFKENLYIIDLLVTAIREQRLSKPVQLIVRPHPAYVTRAREGSAEEMEMIKKMALENVDILMLNMPELLPRNYWYDVSSRDQRLLGSILKNSDLLITQFSTLMIEAAILDVPIINVGFDDLRPVKEKTTYIAHSSNHLKRILDFGFTRTAESEEQLLKLINLYLKDPKLECRERKFVRDNEGGPNKGKAGTAIADYIDSLISSEKTAMPAL
jgi:hypothetical protein